MAEQPDNRGPILFLVVLVLVGLIVVAWGVGREEADGATPVTTMTSVEHR